jgi:hypothetical protein
MSAEPGRIIKVKKEERTFVAEDIQSILKSLDKIVDIYAGIVKTSTNPMIVVDPEISLDYLGGLAKPDKIVTTDED